MVLELFNKVASELSKILPLLFENNPIIPELFAELIYSIEVSQHKATLPNEGEAWNKDIELKLSKMNIYELRLMAKRLSIHGYSNEDRNSLIRRIDRKSKKRIKWKSLKISNIRKPL